MKIELELIGVSERWNAKTDTYTHVIELGFEGVPFEFPVSAEVAQSLVRTAVDHTFAEQAPQPPMLAQPEGKEEYGSFQVAVAEDQPSVQERVVPSSRGQQPVERTQPKPQDGEFCGQG